MSLSKRTTTARRLRAGAALALSSVLPVTGAAAGLLLLAPPAARAQAPAPAGKVRVRVSLIELRSLRDSADEGDIINNDSEPYFSAALQGTDEAPTFTVVPPVKIGEGTKATKSVRYAPPVVLFDGTVAATEAVRAGVNFNEDDGDYDWGKDKVAKTRQAAADRFAALADRGGRSVRLPAEELKALAIAALPVRATSGNNDDHLGDYSLEFPAAGPATEDRVFAATPTVSRGASLWEFHYVLRVEREPVRDSGTANTGGGTPPPVPSPPAPLPQPPAEALKNLKNLVGRYRTSEGTIVTVRAGDTGLTLNAITEESDGKSIPDNQETLYLTLQPDGRTLTGTWDNRVKGEGTAKYRGAAKLTFSTDGRAFTGQVQPATGAPAFAYRGTRIEGRANGEIEGGFTRIDPTFGVTFEWMRRPRAGRFEVNLTVKNLTSSAQRLSASSLKLILEEKEGGAQHVATGNLYRAEGELPALLPSDPTLVPGGTVKVRYLFEGVPEKVTRFSRLQVRGQGEPRWFDLSEGAIAPEARAAGTVAGKLFDFSIQKVERDAETGEWQMVLGVHNSYEARLGVVPTSFSATLIDADGNPVRWDGNLYKASEPGREPVDGTLWLEPGESLRVRLHFAGSKKLRPARVKLDDGLVQTADIPASVVSGN
jgi:hypothetical protein